MVDLNDYIFFLWDSEYWFYEVSEPRILYGPFETLKDAFYGLETLLFTGMLDYYEADEDILISVLT